MNGAMIGSCCVFVCLTSYLIGNVFLLKLPRPLARYALFRSVPYCASLLVTYVPVTISTVMNVDIITIFCCEMLYCLNGALNAAVYVQLMCCHRADDDHLDADADQLSRSIMCEYLDLPLFYDDSAYQRQRTIAAAVAGATMLESH